MNEELAEGLKNAIAHGSSLDDAVKSFISAGYNPVEVREAAQAITSGTLSLMGPTSMVTSPPSSEAPQQAFQQPVQQQVQPPQAQKPKEKEAAGWMKIAIVVLLLVIIGFGIYMLVA